MKRYGINHGSVLESYQEEGPKSPLEEKKEKDALGTYILSHHHHVMVWRWAEIIQVLLLLEGGV